MITGSWVLADESANQSDNIEKGGFTGLLALGSEEMNLTPGVYTDFIKQGNSEMDAGRYIEAIRSYKQAIAEDPGNGTVWLRKARAEYLSGGYDDSLESLDQYTYLEGTTWEGSLLKGEILSGLSEYPDAVTAYEDAVALNKTDPSAYIQLGVAEIYLEEYDNAEDNLISAEKLNPDLAEPYYWKGIIAYNNDDLNVSVACFTQALEKDPVFSRAYTSLADSYLSLGDPDSAAEIVERGLTELPENTELWNKRGVILEKEGKFEEAKRSFRQALIFNSDDMFARSRLQSLSQGTS